eukprot:COSAG06_NODE_1565_length_9086_cov_34.853566_11_plen_80_part_01
MSAMPRDHTCSEKRVTHLLAGGAAAAAARAKARAASIALSCPRVTHSETHVGNIETHVGKRGGRLLLLLLEQFKPCGFIK